MFYKLILLTILLNVVKPQIIIDGKEYPDLIGSNHNPNNPCEAFTPFIRIGPHSYQTDGSSFGEFFASKPRYISNAILDGGAVFQNHEFDEESNGPILNLLHSTFGQYINHEILSSRPPTSFDPSFILGGESIPIEVPLGDPFFDPFQEGGKTLPFSRSAYLEGTGTSAANPRAIINYVTCWVDASTIYGIDEFRLQVLRDNDNPEYMDTQQNFVNETILPFNTQNILDNDNDAGIVKNEELYLSGERRVNENPGLASIHILFVREHNRRVDQLKEIHREDVPDWISEDGVWNSEKLFFEARNWVIAVQQTIIFNEYAATTIGGPLPIYEGYKPDVNPQVSNLFQGAAFRYGHSGVAPVLPRYDEQRSSVGDKLIRDNYFNPDILFYDTTDNLLRGLASYIEETIDMHYVDDLRNFLFGSPTFGGNDLGSINIQRGRDLGLPYYNDAREIFNLTRIVSFSEINNKTEVVNALNSLYPTGPDFADIYILGLAEEHEGFGIVGPLFTKIIKDQYLRTRDADRFYFLNPENLFGFSDEEIEELRITTISDLLLRNTGIARIQCDAFYPSTTYDCGEDPIVDQLETNSTNSAELDGQNYVVSWTYNEDEESIDFVITLRTEGWAGFGFARNPGNMLDTDAIIGYVENGRPIISDFDIQSNRVSGCPGVCLDIEQGGFENVINVGGNEVDGVTTLTFSRLIDTGDELDVVIVDNGEPTAIVWAYGSGDTIGFHSGNKGAAEINFFTGAFAQTSVDSNDDANRVLIAHGVLMIVAWCFVFPFGCAMVKFYPNIITRFRVHVLTQYTGVFIVIIAFCLAVEATAQAGHDHFDHFHAIMGLIASIFAIIVPVLGQCTALVWSATRKYAIFPDWFHYYLGYLTPLYAFAVIFTGIYQKTKNEDEYWYWYFLTGLWIGTLIIVYTSAWIIYTIYFYIKMQRIRKQNKEDDDDFDENGGGDTQYGQVDVVLFVDGVRKFTKENIDIINGIAQCTINYPLNNDDDSIEWDDSDDDDED